MLEFSRKRLRHVNLFFVKLINLAIFYPQTRARISHKFLLACNWHLLAFLGILLSFPCLSQELVKKMCTCLRCPFLVQSCHFLVQSCRDKVVTNAVANVKFSWGKDKENASPFLALLAELVEKCSILYNDFIR